MSTRRPKVPRPAGAPAGTARRPASDPERRGTTDKLTSAEPAAAAPRTKEGQPAKAAKPAKPARSAKTRPEKPSDRSQARAAAREELAAEIRREVPAADTAAAPTRSEPSLKPVPAKSFSGRLLALGIVMVVITVLLAPSVRTYLQQRSEIAALEAEIAREQEVGRELEQALGRWEDPAYIKAQARERIFLVMPGETRYLVKGEHGVEDAEEQAAAQAPQDLEWVDALWDSVLRSATAP